MAGKRKNGNNVIYKDDSAARVRRDRYNGRTSLLSVEDYQK
jgi:hypothetical protein